MDRAATLKFCLDSGPYFPIFPAGLQMHTRPG
jgi:hypothetical protein